MLCRGKLPESTGDKLIAWGDGFQLFLGKLDWTLLGKFELDQGSGSIECLIYRRGKILDQDCRGCLLRIYMLPGNVEVCWRIPNFFKFDSSFA